LLPGFEGLIHGDRHFGGSADVFSTVLQDQESPGREVRELIRRRPLIQVPLQEPGFVPADPDTPGQRIRNNELSQFLFRLHSTPPSTGNYTTPKDPAYIFVRVGRVYRNVHQVGDRGTVKVRNGKMLAHYLGDMCMVFHTGLKHESVEVAFVVKTIRISRERVPARTEHLPRFAIESLGHVLIEDFLKGELAYR
jgi:hypothetical protein